MLLDRKFNENSKNVLKTVIFLLQVGFTGYFVSVFSNCASDSLKTFTALFFLTVSNFVVFFHVIR